jgi:D-amino-acid dehydrogenase
LAREGHKVSLLDRAEPGIAGASFGNVGHIAAELVEPLPSPALLFGFWRQLVALGGPLDLPLRRVPGMLPWIARFARAAFRQEENTQPLAPLVRASRTTLERWLREIGRADLLRCNGHYEVWLSEGGAASADKHARAMEHLGIPTEPAPAEVMEVIVRAASAQRVASAAHAAAARDSRSSRSSAAARDGAAAANSAAPRHSAPARGRASASRSESWHASGSAGIWFPDSGHIADPLEVVRTFASAAVAQGAEFHRADVQALQATGNGLRVVAAESSVTEQLRTRRFDAVIVCTGAWSPALLEPFDLTVPMQAARGYHIEMPGQAALVDAPILYSEQHLVVTPMTGRLRASSYMEFAPVDAPPDVRRPQQLRQKARAAGYDCPVDGPSWVGPRPVLPDYLPGIGRLPAGSPNVFYAIGHQHIGLTLAAVTGDLMADLVAGRTPRHDVSAFDLRRFG